MAAAAPSSDDTWRQFINAAAADIDLGGVATTTTQSTNGFSLPAGTTTGPVSGPGGKGSSTKKAVVRAVTSKAGVAVLSVVGTFILALILLAIIQPGFVEKEPDSKLETRRVSGAKVAIGATVAASVAGVVVGVVAIVQTKARKSA